MKKSDPSSCSGSKRDLKLCYLTLALSLAPLMGAYVYNQGYQIPYECPVRHFTGIPCPTCGMTRSLMAAMRGEWATSADHHLFGPILIVILSGTVICLVVELLAQRPIPLFNYLTFYKRRFITILLYMLLGYYLTRLVVIYQHGILVTNFLNSPLGQFLSSLSNQVT
ncbi:MAG: DUF2752 domain-containing protein [Cyanothece sp. SIO1E1]|nr:DUF2752 domain-containing protein [Cyanothece sp. SIO1E1]